MEAKRRLYFKNLSKIQDFPTAENKIFNKPILFVGGENRYFQKFFSKINEYFQIIHFKYSKRLDSYM